MPLISLVQILGFVLGVAVLLAAFSAAHKYGVFGNSGKSTKNSGAAGIEAAGPGAGGNGASNSNAYMYSSASAVEVCDHLSPTFSSIFNF
jgi:hypothetical protein